MPEESGPLHPEDLDDDLRELVRSNPGQMHLEEYQHTRNAIRAQAPCNLLIFGVGKDSRIWLEANRGGRTDFVEHEPEWIRTTRELLPGVVVHPVRYGTRRRQWRRLLRRQDRLFMEDLPNDVLSLEWDVILVDSPQGGRRSTPGRMKSIYTAAVLGRRSTDVDILVHDCERTVERVYSDRFLGPERMISETDRLRHYRLRPTGSAR